MKPEHLRGAINAFSTDSKYWLKAGDTASDVYRVSLLGYLTETDRTLYDTEVAKPKSKVITALRQLATNYARTLP